ncbi:hypothetical protein [Pedococcus soli]
MTSLTVDGPRPAVEWITSMPYRLTDAEFRVMLLLACDSFDGVTTAPGYDNITQWSGLLRSSVAAAISRLCESTESRPALLRRVGKRQRHTVFAFTGPVTPDDTSCPVTSDGWSDVSSGKTGQVHPSGSAGRVAGDTPVDPSGDAGRTLPSTTRVVTTQATATWVGQRTSSPVASVLGPLQGGLDAEMEVSAREVGSPEAPLCPVRRMYVYAVPGERHAVIRLTVDEGRQWFRDRGIHSMWSRRWRGHQVRQDHLADITAMAIREGWSIRQYTTQPPSRRTT